MILELADIRIHPGQQAAFEKAIELGLSTVACKAKGYRGAKVNRCIETPERFVLQKIMPRRGGFMSRMRDSTSTFERWRTSKYDCSTVETVRDFC